jgi:aminomethyltransferase
VTDTTGTTDPVTTERRSPLDEVHRAAGASFTDFAGWQMPVRYSSDLAEHHAVRTSAGLFDLSHMGEIIVVGPEAAEALDYALAGKLSAIAMGQAKYSLLLGRDGGVIDDLVVYRTGDDRYMVVANASNREVVAEELRNRTSPFECEVFDESDDIALVAIQGPDALEVLQQTPGFGIDGPGNDTEDFVAAVAELKYYRAIAATWDGAPVLVARTGYTGEDGFELFCEARRTVGLWHAVLEAARAHGGRPCGLGSRDTLRLEAGMPLYGNELSPETNPFEVNLGRVVKLEKGEFVGRAALQAVQATGPERKLIGLQMVDNAIPRAGYAVHAGGESVGTVTSGTLSPTLGTKIAMALVPAALAGVGNGFEVIVRDRPFRAEQVKLPFYRRPREQG